MTYETVDRIRNSHRHAKPNPAENPAWANCHMDCGILLAEIEHLKAYQLQMNEILKENAALRNDLTAIGLERDRLQADVERLTRKTPTTHEPVSAHKVQCGCGWVGMTTELVRLDGKHECPACSAEFKALNAWPPLKSEVRHCTNYLTYPGGQSCCTREAGHSGSCLF